MDSQTSNPEQGLSRKQALFIYWFNGLFPILTSIVTPLAVYHKVLKKPNASDIQRYNDLLQEVSRQLVSGTIGLVSYFSGGALTRGLMNLLPDKPGEKDKRDTTGDQHVKMIVGGSILSFIGYSFIRPAVATDILYLLRKNEISSNTTGEGKAQAKAVSPWQQKLKDLVERQLFKEGKPRLRKTAFLSFAILGTYLSALAFSIYGLSRLSRNTPAKSSPPRKPSSPVATTASRLQVPGPVTYNATPYPQPGFRNTYPNPL